MRILIFEDEIINFRNLKHMLEEMEPTNDVMGPFSSVYQGREFFQYDHTVDIIIANTQLADGLCFEVLKHAPKNVPIIFMSEQSEYAFKAFEFLSLSYLKKPIGRKELEEAMAKAKMLRTKTNTYFSLQETKFRGVPAKNEPKNYRERFIVKSSKRDKVILVANTKYIWSEEKTTYIKLLDNSSYPIDMTLENLSQELDPKRFMRVNRKYIISIEQVSHTERLENGKMKIHLKDDESTNIIVSRTRKDEVCKWLNS